MTALTRVCAPFILTLILANLSAALTAGPAQSQAIPACSISDLEISFQMADGLHDQYILAANFRNITNYACALNPAADEPVFSFRGTPPEAFGTHCYPVGSLVHDCVTSRASVVGSSVTLEPGAVAHQSYSWKTARAQSGAQCAIPQALDNTVNQSRAHFRLFSTVLLPQICSSVSASPYLSGPLPGPYVTPGNSQLFPSIHFLPGDDKYYLNEHVPIRAVIDDPGGVLFMDEHSCPSLLLEQRRPDGWVVFMETRSKPCISDSSTSLATTKMDVEAEIRGSELGPGDNQVALSAITKLRNHQQLTVVASPILHLNILDPATIKPKWGPQNKGIAVSLILEKDTYQLGQDIPLHIAMANLGAEHSIFGGEGPKVKVEVRDSCGVPLEPRGEAVWNTHGWCIEYPRGRVVANELSLSDMGLVPDIPGSYTVTAMWSVFAEPACNIVVTSTTGEPVQLPITAESEPTTFYVVDQKHPRGMNVGKCASAAPK